MSSHPVSLRAPRRRAEKGDGGSSAVWKVVALLLGIRGRRPRDRRGRRDAGGRPGARRGARRPGAARRSRMQHDHSAHAGRGDGPEPAAPELRRHDRAERRRTRQGARRLRRDAPARPAGNLVKIHMTLKDMTVQIAPGVKYATWAFDGHGAPGPILHVRQGQTVQMTLTNGGVDPALDRLPRRRIAPNMAFKDVAPGDSFTFRFVGERSRRLHVPLRDEAGARAHRERDVRRAGRRPGDAAPEGGPRVRPRRERVVPERRRHRRRRRRSTCRRRAR